MDRSQPETPPSWAEGPYSIKRHGVTITNCDQEPIQTPGCVQGHGALLVLRPADFTVLQVSENVEALLGQPPAALLGGPAAAVLGVAEAERLRGFLATEPVERNPLYVLTLEARGESPPFDVTVHTVDGLALVELERTGHREADPGPDYYALTKKTVGRLQAATTLTELSQVAVDEVRTLTGFDRVMVYKFHEDGHGEVFAESRIAELPPWRGLHYPAEDIPRPAREMFRQIWLRPVPDVAAPPAELIPLANPDTGRPLVMTHCILRGASVMYTEYLQNMHVAASLTLSIRRGEQLWGLIACHHYAGPRFVPHQVRTACELMAQVVSLLHTTAEEREHLAYRLRIEGVHNLLVTQAAQEGGLAAMTDGKPALLDGLAAGGAALYHRDRWWRVGETPTEPELDALANWISRRPELESATRPLFVTEALSRDYPPGAAFANVASGVLAFPLSRQRRNLLLWFRPEILRHVQWAGNPHDKPTMVGPHGPRLTPRASFELFVESVRGLSRPWLQVEVDAAARLRLLIMELIVGRAEQLADLNADLARSNEELDAFAYVASHDLKEPLRGIHKHAHLLLEKATDLDAESRARVEGLMRLTLRMDSLLDSLLHFSRVGRTNLLLEEEDLNEVLMEAIEMTGAHLEEARADILTPRPLPTVRCDRVRVREIFVNLISNSLKYSDASRKRIEVGYLEPHEEGERPNCPPEALRLRIYWVKDNGIGIHAKHFDQIFKMFRRLHGRDEHGGGAGAGLTIVRKLIERHHGQVWLDAAPGNGSTFFFTLPLGEESE